MATPNCNNASTASYAIAKRALSLVLRCEVTLDCDAPAASGQFIDKDQEPDRTRNSVATPVHLNIEIADLLAQRVAIDAQEIGGPDLVAARSGKRGRQ